MFDEVIFFLLKYYFTRVQVINYIRHLVKLEIILMYEFLYKCL